MMIYMIVSGHRVVFLNTDLTGFYADQLQFILDHNI